MSRYQLRDLSSWLKYLDDNYISDEIADVIDGLDINREDEQKRIIQIAIKPEYEALNDISKQGFDEILSLAIEASETELENVFAAMSFSCIGEVIKKAQFIRNIESAVQQ
jgi:hypothetical protein